MKTKDENLLKAINDVKDRIKDFSSYQLKQELINFKYNFEEGQRNYNNVISAFNYDYCMRYVLWWFKSEYSKCHKVNECFDNLKHNGLNNLNDNLKSTILEYAKHYLRIE